MKNPIFKIRKLKYELGGKIVIDIKKLDIHRGSCYVLYGDIGCGKTTFLNLLYKNYISLNDTIFYENNELNSIIKNDYYKEVFFLPQNSIDPWFKITVKEYITKKINSYKHLSNPQKRYKDIVRQMKLSTYLEANYKNLSDGEKRWINLAIAIACDTKVLLIDGFGQSLGEEKLNILSKILYKKINYDGVSLIACTHVREKLSKIASVYVKLSFGKIIGLRSHKKHIDSSQKSRKSRKSK